MKRSWFSIVAILPCSFLACTGFTPEQQPPLTPINKLAKGITISLQPSESVEAGNRRERRAWRNNRNWGVYHNPNHEQLLMARTLYLSANSQPTIRPMIVRDHLSHLRLTDPNSAWPSDFINQVPFKYPPAKKSSVAIYPELRALDAGNCSLMVAVRSEDRARGDMLPLNFTFLIDTSGSMAGSPIELAQKFMKTFTTVLRKGDRFSVIVSHSFASIAVDNFDYDEATLPSILKTLKAAITPRAGTDLHQGLDLAYQLAEKNYSKGSLNRVVVLSDGAAYAEETLFHTIQRHADDAKRQGIYLVGVGFCQKYDDSYMYTITAAGKGAHIIINNEKDIHKALEKNFVSNFDTAVKDVSLKVITPEGWRVIPSEINKVTSRLSDIQPRHLAPNNQLLYYQRLTAPKVESGSDFVFEVEYRDLHSNKLKTVRIRKTVQDMIFDREPQLSKIEAIHAYVELIRKTQFPLEQNIRENQTIFSAAFEKFSSAWGREGHPELNDLADLMRDYHHIQKLGKHMPGLRFEPRASPAVAIGLTLQKLPLVIRSGQRHQQTIKIAKFLRRPTEPLPREGENFLVMSTGDASDLGSRGFRGGRPVPHPALDFMGWRKIQKKKHPAVHNLSQTTVTLSAPPWARSFSFDYKFFSAEYPLMVNAGHNDTFYAILEAPSTNNGAKTNIAFDGRGNIVAVDSAHFEGNYHPLSNEGTGFDNGGSTPWIRSSWPIKGGEQFKLTFSIHDEEDGVNSSMVILDNFKFRRFESVGSTDALN